MAKPEARVPIRSNARSNRAKILAAACELLGQNPDATLEEIAQAAGVVRRTVHGHFPGRVALLEALAEEASEALRAASARWPDGTEEPEHAFAGFVLAVWPEGDRYRLLLSPAAQNLGQERVTEAVAHRPARRPSRSWSAAGGPGSSTTGSPRPRPAPRGRRTPSVCWRLSRPVSGRGRGAGRGGESHRRRCAGGARGTRGRGGRRHRAGVRRAVQGSVSVVPGGSRADPVDTPTGSASRAGEGGVSARVWSG